MAAKKTPARKLTAAARQKDTTGIENEARKREERRLRSSLKVIAHAVEDLQRQQTQGTKRRLELERKVANLEAKVEELTGKVNDLDLAKQEAPSTT